MPCWLGSDSFLTSDLPKMTVLTSDAYSPLRFKIDKWVNGIFQLLGRHVSRKLPNLFKKLPLKITFKQAKTDLENVDTFKPEKYLWLKKPFKRNFLVNGILASSKVFFCNMCIARPTWSPVQLYGKYLWTHKNTFNELFTFDWVDIISKVFFGL